MASVVEKSPVPRLCERLETHRNGEVIHFQGEPGQHFIPELFRPRFAIITIDPRAGTTLTHADIGVGAFPTSKKEISRGLVIRLTFQKDVNFRHYGFHDQISVNMKATDQGTRLSEDFFGLKGNAKATSFEFMHLKRPGMPDEILLSKVNSPGQASVSTIRLFDYIRVVVNELEAALSRG